MSAFPGLKAAVEATIVQAEMPGMVIAAVRGDEPVEQIAVGDDAEGYPLAIDSLFSVASITKLATALAVLCLVERGGVGLDDELRLHVPEAVASSTDGTTIRALLSHVAGLPAEPTPEPAWALGLDWRQHASACLGARQVTPHGTRLEYSSLGYCLLGIVIERATGVPYREALRGLVLEPLGIDAFIGEEPHRRTTVILNPDDEHAGTELSWPNSVFARSLGLPDSGLVTTAAGALALVRAFQDIPGDLLTRATTAEARRDQVGELGGGLIGDIEWPRAPWGLGAELRGTKTPHWAPLEASPGSFGHVGSNGCLAWCDPAADIAWAWMATRVAGRWLEDAALPINGVLFGRI